MNFYFCETCGKRVTETDIQSGLARNKKLKGIYCVSCAAGINTMEMMPVTGVEIQDTPPKEAPAAGAPPTGLRRTTAMSETVRANAERASERKSASHPSQTPHPPHPPQAPKPSSNGLVLSIAALGVIVVAAALLLSGGKSDPKTDVSQKSRVAQSSVDDPAPAPSHPFKPAAQPVSRPETPTVSSTAPTPSAHAEPPAEPSLPVAPAASPVDLAESKSKEAGTPNTPTPATAPGPVPLANAPLVAPAPPKSLDDDRGADPTSASPPSSSPAPVTAPAAALLKYQKFQDLMLGPGSLADALTLAKSSSAAFEPGDKASCEALAACVEQAASIDDAVKASLSRKKGARITVTRANGVRQLVDITEDNQGAFNVRADELALTQLQEFVREQEAIKDADARIASFEALRGDVETAKRLCTALENGTSRKILEQVIAARLARLNETRAAEDIKKFNELKAAGNFTAALKLGSQILKAHAGSAALAELQPPLDAQVVELQSGSMELRSIFMCDVKRLPDGRIELNFDPGKQQHVLEFVNRSLPAWFTEIEGDIRLKNDGRWDRYIKLGDTLLTHCHDGPQAVDHAGKHYPLEPNGKKDFANSGQHRYRFKASAAGISFQVDDAPAQAAPGPWGGGRLKWPGQYDVLPVAMKIVGRVDPLWLAEMAEVAKDRAKFMTGAYVELKPKPRAAPRPEVEPESIGWSINPNMEKEVRGLAGWNEVGPAWTTDGAEFISPKPKDKQLNRWSSVFWPQALVGAGAELSFEARIDAGQIDVLLPSERAAGQFNTGCLFAVISGDGVQIKPIEVYGDRPGIRGEGKTQAEGKHPHPPGQWRPYQIFYTKGSLAIFAEGKQILETQCAPHAIWPMAFWVTNGQEYRLRNVKIRKLE